MGYLTEYRPSIYLVRVQEQVCMQHMCSTCISSSSLGSPEELYSCGQCRGNMYIVNFFFFRRLLFVLLLVCTKDSRDLLASHSKKTVLLPHRRLSAQLVVTQV